jgi:hypothetical protein
MSETVNKAWRMAVVTLMLPVALAEGADPRGIVGDHNCVDLAAIPESCIRQASSLRVLVRHASVGQGIDWGLACLAGAHPTNPACSGFPAGKYDRGRWVFELRAGNWRAKVDDLVQQAAARANDFDVLTMKFCYLDALGTGHPDWEYYRSRMEQLETAHPGKTSVWWTIPLTRDGQSGTDVFNALVRSYCVAKGKVLFDIADIECHEPNGVKLLNAHGNEIISAKYTKEIHAGHLNPDGRVRVASAWWHLMARIAGWDPHPAGGDPNAVARADFDRDRAVTAMDLLLFSGRWLARGQLLREDINHDGWVDFSDFTEFAGVWHMIAGPTQSPLPR